MANVDITEKRETPLIKRRGLDIFAFYYYLLARVKTVIAIVLCATILACGYVFVLATPQYEATAQIYVVSSKDSVINLSDLQIGSYLTSDYQVIFETWEVNQQVINNLELPYTVRQMRERLTVTNPSNTRVLTISFSSRDANEAALVANEYAEVASQYISDYMRTDKPSIISVALSPLKPAQPKKLLLISCSMILSGLLAVWVIYVLYLYDNKIKTTDDLVKCVGAEPLAMIPTARLTETGSRPKNGTR